MSQYFLFLCENNINTDLIKRGYNILSRNLMNFDAISDVRLTVYLGLDKISEKCAFTEFPK